LIQYIASSTADILLPAASDEIGQPPLQVRQGLADADRQSTAPQGLLPVELGFLAYYGYRSDVLREAAMLASLAGVTADEFLIRSGWIDEVAFYRALSAELALPFTSAPRLSEQTRFPESILAGIAPLAGEEGGFVIAPRGKVLSRLLRHRASAKTRLVVTAPSLLARAVLHHQPRRIAYRCANTLPDRAPHLSSRDGASGGQIAALSAAAGLLSFGAVLLPGPALATFGAAMSPLFLGSAVMRLAACLLGGPVAPTVDGPRREDAALPVYTIIVALYREKRVVARLIDALSGLDYPAAKLDIKLVLESDDRETPQALAKLSLPGFVEVILAPPGMPRTKPRALNIALPLARGRFTVIYDAEDVPDRRQLRLAIDTFARLPRDVACLQARLTIDNTDDSWLTRLFTIEYAALFDVFNPGLVEIGSPIALGGTSNHFRTAVLQEIHGWDAWNVTEDADLGIRLARLGYRVEDLPSSTLDAPAHALDEGVRANLHRPFTASGNGPAAARILALHRRRNRHARDSSQRAALPAFHWALHFAVGRRQAPRNGAGMEQDRVCGRARALLLGCCGGVPPGRRRSQTAAPLAAPSLGWSLAPLLRPRQRRSLEKPVGAGGGTVPLEQDRPWSGADIARQTGQKHMARPATTRSLNTDAPKRHQSSPPDTARHRTAPVIRSLPEIRSCLSV
jgi:hypothetical protein